MTEERIVLRESDPDVEVQAKARALSSPLRLRILRLCRFDAHTNKELADLLGVNPGTMLHHVRTLVQTGFLAAEPARVGPRGARVVPYRATGLSWNTSMPEGGAILVETFLQQIEGLAPEEIDVTWLGLKINEAHRSQLQHRLFELVTEFKERGPDADGLPYSLFTALHPDRAMGGPAEVEPTGSM